MRGTHADRRYTNRELRSSVCAATLPRAAGVICGTACETHTRRNSVGKNDREEGEKERERKRSCRSHNNGRMCGTRIILPRAHLQGDLRATRKPTTNKHVHGKRRASKTAGEGKGVRQLRRPDSRRNRIRRKGTPVSSFFSSSSKIKRRAVSTARLTPLYAPRPTGEKDFERERKGDGKMRSSRLVVQPSQLLHAAVSRDPVSLVRNASPREVVARGRRRTRRAKEAARHGKSR